MFVPFPSLPSRSHARTVCSLWHTCTSHICMACYLYLHNRCATAPSVPTICPSDGLKTQLHNNHIVCVWNCVYIARRDATDLIPVRSWRMQQVVDQWRTYTSSLPKFDGPFWGVWGAGFFPNPVRPCWFPLRFPTIHHTYRWRPAALHGYKNFLSL